VEGRHARAQSIAGQFVDHLEYLQALDGKFVDHVGAGSDYLKNLRDLRERYSAGYQHYKIIHDEAVYFLERLPSRESDKAYLRHPYSPTSRFEEPVQAIPNREFAFWSSDRRER
jgi:hypothetical protein